MKVEFVTMPLNEMFGHASALLSANICCHRVVGIASTEASEGKPGQEIKEKGIEANDEVLR